MRTTTQSKATFRTATATAAEAIGVDRKANRINGAAIIQLGAVNDDRPWTVDEDTLAQVVEFGNRPNKGLKARFTHPNMSSDGMGKYLGRWSNFRIDGDKARADLQLAESAFNSPSGDYGTYVMDLAEEDPEAFGVSVASILDEEIMFDDEHTGELRFAGLIAADVVDEPAATRGGFFSTQSSPLDLSDLPAAVTAILDSHFSNAEPASVAARFREFLNRYYGDEVMAKAIAEPIVATEPQVDHSQYLSRDEAKRFTAAFGDQGARWFLDGLSFEDAQAARIKQLATDNSALIEANGALQVRLDAAIAASGVEPVSAGDGEPIDQKKAHLAARVVELKAKGMSDATARATAKFEAMQVK